MNRISFSIAAAALLCLAGCGSSGRLVGDGGGGGGSSPDTSPGSREAKSRYDLANGCYAMYALQAGAWITRSGNGWSATGAEQPDAEPLFMKPADLGIYLVRDAAGQLLAVGAPASTSATPSASTEWTVDTVSEGVYTLASGGIRLGVDGNGMLSPTGGEGPETLFTFTPASGCLPYPEMPVSIVGETYRGSGTSQPIIGFADVHTHMGMSHEMSLDGSVGPSAGGVLYGTVVHRYGVTHALEDCEAYHGPDGARDANNILEADPTASHDTQGWPSFVDWPARNYLTHQVMYHRWVERAWLAGLRLMVNHGTNIAALCRIGQQYALRPDADCDDMSVAVKQVEYLYDIQDYVDAQYGGPGKGWFRIVTSPQQAREVINEGRMAVVLGIEVAQVLDCGVTFLPDGQEQRNCDIAQIDAEIQRVWDLGVRHIYPYHDIDSSLGGTGIFSGDVLNFLNFMDTGKFWETTECREYPANEPSVREPGAEMSTAIPGTGDDPLSAAFYEATGGVAPVYPPGIRCNARTVTDLGDYALRALMDRGMVIDIDHAAYHSKDIMLDIAEERTPPYPMASSHDAHGGLTSDQAIRMLAAGGIIYPYKGSGIKHVEFIDKLKFWRERAGIPASQPLALGYGADANGFGGHPGPRGAGSDPVVYPFTLFRGDGWSSRYAGFDALQVELLSIPESGKYWHIDEVGMAHYGLVADFVEEVRLEGGTEALDALYNSAEAYVQMWERVYQP